MCEQLKDSLRDFNDLLWNSGAIIGVGTLASGFIVYVIFKLIGWW